MPISCHFRDCKPLLGSSLAHVSRAVASFPTLPLLLVGRKPELAYGISVTWIRGFIIFIEFDENVIIALSVSERCGYISHSVITAVVQRIKVHKCVYV